MYDTLLVSPLPWSSERLGWPEQEMENWLMGKLEQHTDLSLSVRWLWFSVKTALDGIPNFKFFKHSTESAMKSDIDYAHEVDQ